MDRMTERLAELADLKAGWYDGNGQPPTAAALGLAAVLGQAVSTSTTDSVRAHPTVEGGVQLEWRQDELSHCATIGPFGRLHLITVDPADPPPVVHGQPRAHAPSPAARSPYAAAASALCTEAAAMERLQEQLAWAVRPNPEPRLDAATLRAAARLLESLEIE